MSDKNRQLVILFCVGIFGVALVLLILGVVAHRATLTYFRAHASRQMMGAGHPYKKETGDYAKTLLVLGDSTGAGVGADTPEDSVAGRLARYIGATHVENYAVSGAASADLQTQINKAILNSYDYILIQIGGNNVIFFHDIRQAAKRLDVAMMTLPAARLTILMSAGNVGVATMFPLFIRPFHTLLNLELHKWFRKVAKRRGALYLNLYEPRQFDAFIREPERYLSEDGLHPSSEGYALWFEKVKKALET